MKNNGVNVLNANAMTPTRILRMACPVIAAVCLAGGLALAGQPLAAVAALLASGWMLLTVRWPAAWRVTAALVVLVALAVAGITLKAAPGLMLAGVTAALGGWELALAELKGEGAGERLLVRGHLRLLGLVLGLGLVVGVVGQNIRLELPFLVVILLAGLAVWALERILKSLAQ